MTKKKKRKRKPGPREEQLIIDGDPDAALRRLIGDDSVNAPLIEVHYLTYAPGAEFTCPFCGKRSALAVASVVAGVPTPDANDVVSAHQGSCPNYPGADMGGYKIVPVIDR